MELSRLEDVHSLEPAKGGLVTNGKTAACVLLFLCLCPLVGCGYLDEELLVSDEQFQQSLTLEGMSISGSGSGHGYGRSYGCGGIRLHRSRIPLARGVALPYLGATTIKSPSQMTDQEILNETNIGVIDETPKKGEPAVGGVAAAYYASKERRDREIARYYASANPVDAVQPGGEEEVGEGE
jgi:hypothetical protein